MRRTTPVRSWLRRAVIAAGAMLLGVGAVDLHGVTAGHALAADEPVVTGARHGGQATHWEAVESVAWPECPDCLLRAPSSGTVIPSLALVRPLTPTVAVAPRSAHPPGAVQGSAAAPRAPPGR